MGNGKILIIEDDVSICDILSYKLKKEGYEVKCCIRGTEGLKEIETFKPEIVLLDIMLPDMTGFDVCKEITINYKTPVIMLTARNDITDKILGLELGADDYITKPFDIREVAARIRVVLRRINCMAETQNDKNDIVELPEGISIDKLSRKIYRKGEELKLKPKEYNLLIMLEENKNRVLTREQLLDGVWGYDFDGSLRTVDVHIQRIRKKLYPDNMEGVIETIFGVGYMLRCSK
jgi:DNA-binding response OmpR family regulator